MSKKKESESSVLFVLDMIKSDRYYKTHSPIAFIQKNSMFNSVVSFLGVTQKVLSLEISSFWTHDSISKVCKIVTMIWLTTYLREWNYSRQIRNSATTPFKYFLGIIKVILRLRQTPTTENYSSIPKSVFFLFALNKSLHYNLIICLLYNNYL